MHNLYTIADFTDEELETNRLAKLVVEGGLGICKSCGAAESELTAHPTCHIHRQYKAFVNAYIKESWHDPLVAEKRAEQLWQNTYLPLALGK